MSKCRYNSDLNQITYGHWIRGLFRCNADVFQICIVNLIQSWFRSNICISDIIQTWVRYETYQPLQCESISDLKFIWNSDVFQINLCKTYEIQMYFRSTSAMWVHLITEIIDTEWQTGVAIINWHRNASDLKRNLLEPHLCSDEKKSWPNSSNVN